MTGTVQIVCPKAPPHVGSVAAVREPFPFDVTRFYWYCSWCGARVKVVA